MNQPEGVLFSHNDRSAVHHPTYYTATSIKIYNLTKNIDLKIILLIEKALKCVYNFKAKKIVLPRIDSELQSKGVLFIAVVCYLEITDL